jgi:hypothetical protein
MAKRRRPPMGRARFSRRWEIGMPLIIAGAALAGLMVGVRGAEGLFWVGAGLVAVGAAAFFGSSGRS